MQQEADFITVKRLEDELERQRMEPKVMEPNTERKTSPSQTHGGSWSGRIDAREEKVLEALYGVERGREGQMLPGLDVLMEERERLGKDVEADEVEQGRLNGSPDI